MKKFILYLLGFIAIVCLIDIGFGYCCDYLYRTSKGGDTYKVRYGISENKSEIIIMGSSRASHHYNPQILKDSLGMDVYNMGIDGSGIILMNAFYRLISQRYTPKVIIYELTPEFDCYEFAEDAHDSRYLSMLKPYFREDCLKDIFDHVDSKERIKLYSGLYRYNTKFINLVRFTISPSNGPQNGFRPLDKTLDLNNLKRNTNNNNLIIDSLKLYYLKDLIRRCNKEHVQLIFTVSPKYKPLDANIYKPLLQLALDESCFILYHYTDERFIDQDGLFADVNHLNINGAELYTSTVAKEVKQIININKNK